MEVNKVLCGHTLDILRTLPSESVSCVFTSPPYFYARDYNSEPIIWDGDENCQHEWNIIAPISCATEGDKPGANSKVAIHRTNAENRPGKPSEFCHLCGAWSGSLGLEPTPDLFIHHLMTIFTECMRVLKKSGSLWINIDDSHSSNGKDVFDTEKYNSKNGIHCGRARKIAGVKAKSLIGIPARLQLAMIDAGWIIRNSLIWQKPNSCPESVRDRFTSDFEHIFFVVKNNDTLYWKNHKTLLMVDKQPKGIRGIEGEDWDWVKCRSCLGKGCDKCDNLGKKKKSNWESRDYYFNQQFEPQQQSSIDRTKRQYNGAKTIGIQGGFDVAKQQYYADKIGNEPNPTRNMRAVWDISTKPLHEAHFAPFPLDLAEKVINTSVPEQICDICGLPREQVYRDTGNIIDQAGYIQGHDGKTGLHIGTSETSSLRTGCVKEKAQGGLTHCACENPTYHAGIILDPFGGSGTVAVQAKVMNRDYILIDSNPDYCEMAERRIGNTITQLTLF
jgi:DNA modification methylase